MFLGFPEPGASVISSWVRFGDRDAQDLVRPENSGLDVGVVSPAAPVMGNHRETRMRRVIGIDIHRTFSEVVIWEASSDMPAGST
jgi:hypothetical protein